MFIRLEKNGGMNVIIMILLDSKEILISAF
jgi:hypothetical protein